MSLVFYQSTVSVTEPNFEQKLFVKTKGSELGSKILRILRIQPPKNVTPIADFNC